MKCIIIEDQHPAQRILEKYIEDLGSLELRGTFSGAIPALELIKREEIDLIFLDIHLPVLSGIDFLRSLKNPPSVILTTAFADYALEGFDLEVVDYLLKPISFPRFVKAVSRVPQQAKLNAQSPVRIDNEPSIVIKAGYEHIRVSIENIYIIKSDADYTELITKDKKLLSNEPLRYWLDRLDGFVQVHRSYLINSRHIIKVAGNQVFLKDDHIVPIGRAYKEYFMRSFLG